MITITVKGLLGQNHINIFNNNMRQRDLLRDNALTSHKFLAGAVAYLVAVSACYPLHLVRTRLTPHLEGYEHYRGIADASKRIYQSEGLLGFYSGIAPTMLVAVPNFAISYIQGIYVVR
jgi:hypothetical protein